MKITKSFKIALNIILHSKVRSWLTIIGIVIGIAAIVTIISLGQGAQRTLEQNLNSLSADIITINPGSSRAFGAGVAFRQGGGGFEFGGPSSGNTAKNLTTRDVMALRGIQNIAYIQGTISGSAEDASYLGKTARVSVQGVDPAVWKNFVTTELASGRYLSQGDANVVVVGSRIATSTFTDMQINRQITIGGATFRIVGILEQSGQDDSRIYMPIENAVTILENKDRKSFDSISVKIKDLSQTDDTVEKITSALMLSHGVLQTSKQDFSVTSQKSIQERVSSTLSSMSLFLSAIAAISLVVGAIGIMNTMFTSVLEKTREIGILKAIGAKNRDILAIFLLNAGTIGLIGGIFGVIIGLLASGYLGSFISGGAGGDLGRLSLANAYVSPQLVIGVFLVSIAVGLISGAIPAYRASRLKPVDALRYE